jgi:hypothetical protein
MDDHCKCEHKHHLKPSPELEPLGLWNSYPYEGAFLKLYTPVYVRMCIQRESKQLHTNTDCMPPVHCRRQTSKCCTKWFLYLEELPSEPAVITCWDNRVMVVPYPDLPHPKQWSWCSCTPQSPHWNLICATKEEKKRRAQNRFPMFNTVSIQSSKLRSKNYQTEC